MKTASRMTRLGLILAVATVTGCSGDEEGPSPEEIAAQKERQANRRARMFSDKRGDRPPAPAAAVEVDSGEGKKNPVKSGTSNSEASFTGGLDGALGGAYEGESYGSDKVDFSEPQEAPAEEVDKTSLFKDRLLVPYHKADAGQTHKDTRFGDRSLLEDKKKQQLAPRVLELRLKALGKRVKQMHVAWMAQRGSPTQRSLEKEGRKLAKALDPLMKDISSKAAISVHVRDLVTQRTLYDYRGTELSNPASNQKMLTASAALDLVGPEFRFKTEAYRRGDTLFLTGGGDPTLTETKIIVMAKELAETTDIKSVKKFVIDEKNFSAPRFIPGIELDEVGFSYMAPTGPLSMNKNVIKISVKPTVANQACVIDVEPMNSHIIVDGQTATLRSVDQPGVTVRTLEDGDKTVVMVRGKLQVGDKPVVVKRRIYDPGRFAGEAFAQAMADAAGTMRLPVKSEERPRNALLLKTWESEPLFEIVKSAMAYSDNFKTEMVLRTMAWKMTGQPGDYEAGSSVLEGYWATIGINPKALVAENGSGLSRAGRFTSAGLVDLVSATHMTQFPNSGLLAVLPVAGQPGTLRNRHKAARGRLKAKTGTLNGVSALSGILADMRGEPVLGLSIMLNPSREGSLGVGARHAAEEKIVHALLGYLKSRKPARRARRR